MRNDEELTPLHRAVKYDQVELVELLLAAGAEVNTADGNGETPLHTATWKGYAGIASLLLAAGAEVDTFIKSSNNTPLPGGCRGKTRPP